MSGRFPKFIIAALTVVASAHAYSAENLPPCSTQGDMKSAEWRSNCDEAIAHSSSSKQIASLLYGRAYAAVETFRYDDALKDLDLALTMVPGQVDYLRERAYARHFNGDAQGAYEDRAREFELTPDSPDALLARGIAALWLGRFDDASKDVKLALKLGKSAGKLEVQTAAKGWQSDIDLWRRVSKGGDAARLCSDDRVPDKLSVKTIVGDCTKAFFEAKTGVARADALTTRSMAWLVTTGDQKHSTEDLAVAKVYDPENVRRYINLGYSYLQSNHSWAANREFERALAIEHNPYALAGRAAARKNLGDKEGALSDAQDSNELEPNEAATEVLAGLAYERGDKDQARELYQLLYDRGSRSDEVTVRLRELEVP